MVETSFEANVLFNWENKPWAIFELKDINLWHLFLLYPMKLDKYWIKKNIDFIKSRFEIRTVFKKNCHITCTTD